MENEANFEGNNLKERLKADLLRAYKQAIDVSELGLLEVELKQLEGKGEGDLTPEENVKLQNIKNELSLSEIIVPGITEYRIILELLGLNAERVNEVLSHENAHANVAEQSITQSLEGFAIRWVREKDGRIFPHPYIRTKTIKSVVKEPISYLEEELKIIKAPELYGDKLSLGDIQAFNRITEKLNILKEQLDKDNP